MSSRGNTRAQTPDVEELLAQLGPSTRVKHEEMSLTTQNGCVQATIMADARNDAGIDLNNPGNIDEYYYRDFGVVILDLKGVFRE